MMVRVVPVSMPMLQRQGASAGTVTGVARRSVIFMACPVLLVARPR